MSKVLEHLLSKGLLVLLLRLFDGRCSLSKQHGPLLPRVDLVLFFVYEIDAHPHIIVDINLVRLMQLNAAIFIFRSCMVRIKPISEKLGLDWHVWVHIAQLEPRMETVSFLLLEHLIALGWSARPGGNRASLLGCLGLLRC